MHLKNPACPNFLDKADSRFSSLYNTMDNVFRQLRAKHVAAETKSTEAFTKDGEERLWPYYKYCFPRVNVLLIICTIS